MGRYAGKRAPGVFSLSIAPRMTGHTEIEESRPYRSVYGLQFPDRRPTSQSLKPAAPPDSLLSVMIVNAYLADGDLDSDQNGHEAEEPSLWLLGQGLSSVAFLGSMDHCHGPTPSRFRRLPCTPDHDCRHQSHTGQERRRVHNLRRSRNPEPFLFRRSLHDR